MQVHHFFPNLYAAAGQLGSGHTSFDYDPAKFARVLQAYPLDQRQAAEEYLATLTPAQLADVAQGDDYVDGSPVNCYAATLLNALYEAL